jgi:FkbM family methyltransferase
MNLQKLAEHTIDVDLLPEIPIVLDVGCRRFDFTDAILKLRPGAIVIAMDPDKEIASGVFSISGSSAGPLNCMFWNMALVGDGKTKSNYASYSDGEGNLLIEGDKYYDAKIYEVPCIDITTLMRHCEVKRWDVVKLDCEGSEFDILWNWPGPIATQISVEFHDGADATKNLAYFEDLWRRLPDYRIAQHPRAKLGDWFGHWDSVLTLKA